MKEFEGNRYDGSTKSNNAKPNTPSKGNNTFTNQQPKGKGRGGRGNNAPRQRVYVTEVHDDDGNQDEHAEQEPGEDPEDGGADQADEQQEQDDAAEGEEEAAEDADQADDLFEAIRCLTLQEDFKASHLAASSAATPRALPNAKLSHTVQYVARKAIGKVTHSLDLLQVPPAAKEKLLQPRRRNLMRKAVRAKRSWPWFILVASAW